MYLFIIAWITNLVEDESKKNSLMLRVTCEIQQLEAEPIQTRYDLSGFERIKETDSNMQTGTKKKERSISYLIVMLW